jgi:hypothetical protein
MVLCESCWSWFDPLQFVSNLFLLAQNCYRSGTYYFFYCDHHCVQINSLLMLPREISALAQFCSLLGNSTLLHVLRETASDKYASSSSVQGF